ncbi:sugar ABC transporter permease [Brevundimonas sp.]|uniref:carbohydrate ABC transporter permease n=1 Tax=Brevundimonas sp. TaxID=1871086 RepID=UPI001DE919EF|nr:sugar ABC transporter permease [Brevundimonas sp.]MBA3999437.1 sugar ABC transporter permease [Brevundimonas sp.]
MSTQAPAVAARPPGRRTRDWSGLPFVTPYLFVFVTFLIGPMIAGVILSLYKADLFGGATFVGVENYVRLMRDQVFVQAVGNSFYFVVLTVPSLALLGLLLALALNSQTRTAAILRGVFFASSVLSVTVVTLIWRMVLISDGGLIANGLEASGQSPIPFLDDPGLVMPAIALTTVWWCLGLPMMIFLAALQQVPKELYEAAALDRAGPLIRLWRITLPSIRRAVALVVVIQIVLQFQLFGQAQLMTQGGPNGASRPIVLFIYEVGFRRWDIGYAAAASQILFAIILMAAMVQFLIARTREEQS